MEAGKVTTEELRFEKALQGYRAYCLLNVLLYGILLAAGLGVAFLPSPKNAEGVDPELPDEGLVFLFDPSAMRVIGIGVAIVAVVLVILALMALRRGRSETAYSLHLANIAAGISSCVLTPFCAWLMKEWMRPEFKARYLGNSSTVPIPSRKESGSDSPTFKL